MFHITWLSGLSITSHLASGAGGQGSRWGSKTKKAVDLYFAENELPVMLKPAYNFFGLSLSQKVLDAVSHFTANRECASRLLQKYSLTIFKTDMENILSGGFDAELQNRVRYFVQQRKLNCSLISYQEMP